MPFDVSPAGLRELVSRGESPTVEFKTRFSIDRAVARHLVAFANSDGGILLFGIGDRGEVLGLSEEDASQTMARLKKLAATLLPASTYQIGKAELDGRLVVYLAVEETPESTRPIRLATGDALQMTDGAIVELQPAPAQASAARRIRVFVTMSFRDEEEPALVDYFEAMKRAAVATGLPIELVRIDLVEGDYEISQRIMDEIDSVDVVLADFTLNPANVYFEVGYARGRGCRIIQSARK